MCIPVSFEVAGKIQDLACATDRYKQRVSLLHVYFSPELENGDKDTSVLCSDFL